MKNSVRLSLVDRMEKSEITLSLSIRRIVLLLSLVIVTSAFFVKCRAAESVGQVGDLSALQMNIDGRAKDVISWMRSDFVDRQHPKFKSYDILGIAATYGCSDKSIASYISTIMDFNYDPKRDVLEPEVFSLPPLVRYLYQFGSCLNAEQRQHIIERLKSKIEIYGHGTINHAIMFSSSLYLLAQYFPEVVWRGIGGKQYSSDELMAEMKGLIQGRYISFFREGHYEQFSPTYSLMNLFPLLNLYDFSNDQDMATLADANATIAVGILKLNSFHGKILPPLTRSNFSQLNTLAGASGVKVSVGQQILWFYFGEPQIGLYDIQSRTEPAYAIMLALSKWRPRGSILSLNNSLERTGRLSTVTPRFSIWGRPTKPEIVGSATISENYAIGLGNAEFDPYGYNEDTKLFEILLKTEKADNSIECYHPYWRSNAGEDGWLSDRSSPFVEGELSEDRGVLIYDIPDKDPWPIRDQSNRNYKLRGENRDGLLRVFQCRFPRAMDQIIVDGQYIFVSEHNSFVGVKNLKGSFSIAAERQGIARSGYKSVKIYEPKGAMYFRVGVKSESLDFEKFILSFKSDVVSYDSQSNRVEFADENNRVVSVRYSLENLNEGTWVSAMPIIAVNDKLKVAPKMGYVHSSRVSIENNRMTIHSSSGDLYITLEEALFRIVEQPRSRY